MTTTKAATAARKTRVRVWVRDHLIQSEAIWGATEKTATPLPVPEALRIAANDLKASLDAASAFTSMLLADGWEVEIIPCDLVLEHPRVKTEEQAVRRLRQLGLATEQFDFWECDADELVPPFLTPSIPTRTDRMSPEDRPEVMERR